MKLYKTLILLLFCCTLITACSSGKTSKESESKPEKWSVDDFALYDENNKLYNYPENESLFLDYYNEEDKKYQTKREVKLSSPAKVVLAQYDLSDFYCSVTRYPILGSNNDEQDEIEKNYLEKYPDANEAIKHTKELEKDDLSLFIYGKFILKDNKLVQLDLDESGQPTDANYKNYEIYEISFYIKNDEIIQICVENKAPGSNRRDSRLKKYKNSQTAN